MSAQVKFAGDTYPGGFANGLSFLDSDTMNRFEVSYEDADKTVLTTKDNITLSCIHEKVNGSDVRKYVTSIENCSDNTVTMEMLTSFVITDIKADKLYRMLSFWSSEGRLKVDDLYDLNMEKSWSGHGARVEKFGSIGSMPVRKYFPFVALEDSESGQFIAATLYSPSSWQIELMIRREDTITLAGGIADADFGQWVKNLNPGEKFTAPTALVAKGHSLLEVCDKLIKAQSPDISTIDDHMGITFNEYCTTWGDPSFENIKKIVDKLEGKGFQYLVMDAGWYAKPGEAWWDYIGSWKVEPERFPNGLKELTEYVRNKGMIPGIWFEPESVTKNCDLYSKEEYLLKKFGVPITVAERRFLDMEKDIVREHLKKDVINLLKDNGFGYIKIDYNDNIGIGCEGYESLGEGLRRKLLATQDFFKELRCEIPDLVIENCSSGGHRLEPSMMSLVSMASFSDAHETLAIPIIAANLLRLVRAEQNQIWAVLRKDDSDDRLFYSLCSTFMGRVGLSGDIYDLTDHRWSLVESGLDFYRKAADIIKYGTVTLIDSINGSYNNPVGNQTVVKEYDNKELIIIHRFKGSDFTLNSKLFDNKKVLAQYGDLSNELSAKAWIVEK